MRISDWSSDVCSSDLFFERYVSYDFTAGLEDSLDDVSGGRAEWQKVLEDFWRDFKPKTVEVMEQKPSEVTQAIDEFLAPTLFPDKGDGSDPRDRKSTRLNSSH